jgi:hypothetical protein
MKRAKVKERRGLLRLFADEIRRHGIIPGEFPDPDHCRCGRRYSLYTKGKAADQIPWCIAESLVEIVERKENRRG